MADEQRKKIIEGFDEQIEELNAKLGNMATLLGDKMAAKLKILANNAGDFVNAFEKGENIAKGLDKKLKSVRDETDKLGMKKLKLENDLARVQRDGLKGAEDKIRKALLENKLATKQLEDTSSTLTKLKQVVDEEEKITTEKKKQNNLLDQSKKLFKDAIEPLAKLFTVAGFIKAIVDGAIRFNKNSVDISHNLGYGADKADDMASNFRSISLTSGNINVNTKNLAAAMGELNAATGGVADYSADTLETQIMLTKQFGLTGEEAAGIYKFSVLQNKSASQTNDEMVAAFATTRNLVKGSANFKTTMAEAAKVSGQLALNLKNNPALITSAVVQAQALGTTLEQTKNQGRKLLDFESSISNELEAELMTGQQMNLERARAAALQGDQVTVMKELANQGMTLEKFSSMNVLAQESFAKAVGLSADELSNQLNKQKIAKEQGKSLAEVQADELKEAQKRQNVQERFNALVEKLQDLIGMIGVVLKPIFTTFTYITDHALLLYSILGLIALSRLPAIAKGFSNIGGGIKESVLNTKKLFSKEGRASLFGGGDKVKAAAETTAGAGDKTGAAGPKAGEGIKSTLTGIADGIKAFKEVDFKDILKLGLSALALVVLTPAIPALLLLQLIKGDLIKSALEGIGLGLKAFGEAISGAAGEIVIAELLLAGLGLALWTFVPIVKAFVPVIQAFGDVILKTFTGIGIVIKSAADGISTLFTSLGNVDIAHLLLVGPALISVGLGLASLGAGGVISAIGAFLGGDPIAKIERLAAAGDGLQKAATGLQGVATALTQVAAALASIDVSKLNALDNFASNRSSESVIGGITSFLTAPIKAIGSMVEGAGGGTDNTEMVKAINEVRDAVNKLYAKDTSIHMDGKKVGTSLTQGSHKVA
jgi:hypothetical protein